MSVFRSCDVNTVSLSLVVIQDRGIKVTADEVIIIRRTLGVLKADPSRDDSISRGGWTISRS